MMIDLFVGQFVILIKVLEIENYSQLANLVHIFQDHIIFIGSYKMNNDDIYAWIIARPGNYPGKHLQSQPRTFQALKPVQPKAQFHLVIKALGEYIRQNMQAGRGINLRNFGAFAFEVDTDLVKPAQLSNFDITKDLSGQREQRLHNHKIRPCFIPDAKLKDTLLRFPGKQEIEKPKSQHSIYQKGFGMIYCNPVPIAYSCYLNKQVATEILNAFSRAVCDLTDLGKSMNIKIGVITINIINRNLTYSYDVNFSKSLNNTDYEKKMKKSLAKTKEHWVNTHDNKWANSTLSSLINKPDPNQVGQVYEKGLALKIMSLDMNTTEKAFKNKQI